MHESKLVPIFIYWLLCCKHITILCLTLLHDSAALILILYMLCIVILFYCNNEYSQSQSHIGLCIRIAMLDRVRLFQSFSFYFMLCSTTHLLMHDSYDVDISSLLYFGIHKKTNSVWKLLSRGCTWLAASDGYQYTVFLPNIFRKMKCSFWQPMIHGYTKGSVT